MKRFLALILVASALQSCSLLQMGIDFHQQQPVEHFNLMTGYCSPTYNHHNSTEGYPSYLHCNLLQKLHSLRNRPPTT